MAGHQEWSLALRNLPELPVSAVLPDVAAALAETGLAVLSAPPGAGKTTLVPLTLLDAPWRGDEGRILLLEPRRLAARAAAARMASLLGETVGATIGTRMRLDSRISAETRIEVVTEGVFARMILDDPELKGVAAVLFDEFHERSLDADLGLALALDCRAALRPDLRILVMSATLDVAGVAALLDHPPVIESHGRSFPVEIIHQDRRPDERIEDAVTRAIVSALQKLEGSILAFLPGQAEILRVAERLEGRVDPAILIAPLYGALGQSEQDAAIRPARDGRRKVVLATSIAETSITIDGVRIVIDCGLQRLPVFEASTGITRLETVRVSRASADQRAGRAGRTEPGVAIRLWHPGQTAALPPFTPPEILASDLSRLVLDLAEWGVNDATTLAFLDPPPSAHWAEARALLQRIGALDGTGRMTQRGRAMRALALPPRLAAMAAGAAEAGYGLAACRLAVLLTEQGLGGSDIDLDERLARWRNERGQRAQAASALAERMARQIKSSARRDGEAPGAGVLLLDAFPDRIALARGKIGAFVMANGRGAELHETERLARAPMLVIADLTGKAAGQRVLSAAAISRADIEAYRPELITTGEEVAFDRQAKAVRARRVVRIGAAVLEEVPLPRPRGPAVAAALAEGLRDVGLAELPFSKEAMHLRERLDFLFRTLGEPWPDMSEAALLARLEDWFVPFQGEATSLDSIRPGSLSEGLQVLIPADLQRRLGELAPTHFEAPTGQRHPIHYDGEEPTLSIRVQELYGLTRHPTIGGGRRPLLLELLSPAHRPIQTTRDLPGFWAGSWKEVRAEMRGRYPRHPWPDDPAAALPTTLVKPRGS
ncbi:ATP-dependent helicase HrpB [Xaviernesmea oryzae]|uniref:ATP-dependent helicase HrpB n=1 Tax=Xaviernesmea oryzae TaxID=464029 RepID=A0A1Q9AYB0_9HYPH|nr:ATP-dependent helicase HrpB [Xaviernesmea oryzae]OLP60448.1 ATP-dependent helicase HrpB [Xaviernesmea oryzae]SEK18448.1 ATP-dependent helicase HrpB [Xaviernesmea oryzae]